MLGAFQVDRTGNLANWHTGSPDAIPAVGGAMDLATGAKMTFVMMSLLTKKGRSKLVEQCTMPLTGVGCVSRIYTDHGVIDVGVDGARAIELVDGLSIEDLRALTGLDTVIPEPAAEPSAEPVASTPSAAISGWAQW